MATSTCVHIATRGVRDQLQTEFATSYKPILAFIELFAPILAIAQGIIDNSALHFALSKKLATLIDTLLHMLKFAHAGRPSLALQSLSPSLFHPTIPNFRPTTELERKHSIPILHVTSGRN